MGSALPFGGFAGSDEALPGTCDIVAELWASALCTRPLILVRARAQQRLAGTLAAKCKLECAQEAAAPRTLWPSG